MTYDTEEETEHGAKSRKDRGAIKKLELSFKKTILHKKMKKLYQTICSTTVLPYQQQTEVLLTLLPSTLVLTKKTFRQFLVTYDDKSMSLTRIGTVVFVFEIPHMMFLPIRVLILSLYQKSLCRS